jgi:hypothetical protein
MTEKLQVEVITTNILAHRRNTREYILESLEWAGINYREIWSAYTCFSPPNITYLLTYLLTPWSRVLEKLTSKLCS